MAKQKRKTLDLGNLDGKLSSDNYMKDKITEYKMAFVKNNIEIIPLNFKGIINKHGKLEKKVGFPKGWKEYTNEDYCQSWVMSKEYYNSGIAIKTGKINNITVVDIDTKDEDIIKKILEYLELKSLQDTTCIETNKGYHLYFKYNEKLKQTTNFREDIFGKGSIDIRNDGGIVYAPPTKYSCEGFEAEYKLAGDLDLDSFIEELLGGGLIEEISDKFLEIQNKNTHNKKITDFSPAISPPTSEDEDLVIVDKEVYNIDKRNKQIKENKKMTSVEFDKLKIAVLNLDKKRATGYSGNGNWLDVGMALYNNGDNMNNKTLKLWEEFSKQCNEKYDEMICMNKWMTFTPTENGLTIASIHHWLKEDNPEEHKKLEIKDTLEDKERFKNAYFVNMQYNEEKKEYEGKPNIDGLVTLMNKEMMRTKKNEYIQVDDENNHYLMVKKDAIDDYAMYTFFDGKKKINPFNLWYENINRKNVIGLKFDPSMKEDPKYYNIYKGMNYKTTDDLDYSKIDGFLNQIKDGWANGDDKTNEYLLNWFAHIIQKPNVKTQVAIVIPSETEGNGKNIILNQIEKILGSLYLSTSSVDDIIGTFNPLAEGRILINLNECTWAGRKQQSGMLKALVTEDTMRINNKNVKPYMIENYSNVVVTSNEENPIEIGKVARRYYVIEIRERKLTSTEVKSILDTDVQVLFNYLMNRDISNFDPKDFEDTEKTQQIKEFSFGTEFIYWKHCLDNNHIEHHDYSISWDDLKDYKFKILKSHIIKSYHNLEYGYNQKMTDNQFWKISKQIFPNLKLINADKNHKPRCELYDSDEMKKDFNKFFGNEYY